MKFLPNTLRGWLRLGVLVALLLWANDHYGGSRICWTWLTYAPQPGDIVFQSLPHGELVDAIEGVTHSPFSHCGVVLKMEGRWVVWESIGHVRATPLWIWMVRGRRGGIAVYRLKEAYQSRLPEFEKELLAYAGKPYDFRYEFSNDAIYCSELPYKAFAKATGESLGRVQTLGELDWKPFAGLIRSMEAGEVPLDRKMITPEALSRAPQLRKILRRGI